MEHLNYQHLLYFWRVARDGGLKRACDHLNLTLPTVSKQIHLLEDAVGQPLFAKNGRRLVLTDTGKIVYRYADEIFALGREMQDDLNDRPVGKPLRFSVGIGDVVPKAMALKCLDVVRRLPTPIHMICREGKTERLLADLALHDLDLILTDSPADPLIKIRSFSHLLGESAVCFFSASKSAGTYRRNFPRCLNNAPMLLPTDNTALRRSLDRWFEMIQVRPNVLGEFEDSALMMEFGMKGLGLFPAPMSTARETEHPYRVKNVGIAGDVRERLYAVTVERRIKHPAASAICSQVWKA